MNEGFGKELHKKGHSVKRSGPFSEPQDSQNCELCRYRYRLETLSELNFPFCIGFPLRMVLGLPRRNTDTEFDGELIILQHSDTDLSSVVINSVFIV